MTKQNTKKPKRGRPELPDAVKWNKAITVRVQATTRDRFLDLSKPHRSQAAAFTHLVNNPIL